MHLEVITAAFLVCHCINQTGRTEALVDLKPKGGFEFAPLKSQGMHMAKRSFCVIKRKIQNYSSSLNKVLYSSFYLRKKGLQMVPKRASEGTGLFQVRVERSLPVPSGQLPGEQGLSSAAER